MPDRVGSCRVTGFGHPGKTNSEGTHYDNGTGTVVICQGIHVYESVPRLHEGLALFIRGAKLMFVKPGVAEARLAKPSQAMVTANSTVVPVTVGLGPPRRAVAHS